MGSIVCTVTSVHNYQHKLCNKTKNRGFNGKHPLGIFSRIRILRLCVFKNVFLLMKEGLFSCKHICFPNYLICAFVFYVFSQTHWEYSLLLNIILLTALVAVFNGQNQLLRKYCRERVKIFRCKNLSSSIYKSFQRVNSKYCVLPGTSFSNTVKFSLPSGWENKSVSWYIRKMIWKTIVKLFVSVKHKSILLFIWTYWRHVKINNKILLCVDRNK